MKLRIIRILKDELARFGEPLPQWIDVLLYSLNQFIDQVGKALQGQLSLQDNLLSKIVTLTVTHNTEQTVNAYITGNVQAKLLGATPLLVQKSSANATAVDRNVITGFGVNQYQNGSLGIVCQFSQGAGVSASVTFIIYYI